MSLRFYAILSLLAHLALIAILASGALRWPHKEIDIAQPIPVEIETYSEKSQSPTPLKESAKTDEPNKPDPVKALPKTELKNQAPLPSPPLKPLQSARPSENKPKAEAEKTDADALPIPNKTSKAHIKPKEADQPKAPPQPKPRQPSPKASEKAKTKPAPQDAMSILKNLQDTAKNLGNKKEARIVAQSGQGGELSAQVTASELDRVRRQIESEWNVPGAVQGAHKIIVPIQIWVNPDRTVRDAKVINTQLMGNPTYRTMAESALKAVMKFKNRPLLLPLEKYHIWKDITINFDPRDLL